MFLDLAATLNRESKMLNRLLIMGALLWASSVSSSPVQQFHPMAETIVLTPDTEHIRFPHEESCRHFYLVLSAGDISLKTCPDDKLFDYLKRRCVEKEGAKCWVRHLVEDMDLVPVHLRVTDKRKCPQPFGKFPDVTDCTHYHQCLAGKATTKKCAPYEYFDKIKRKCVAEISAVCADETDVVEPGYKCPRSLGSFSFSRDCSKYYECIEQMPDLKTCQKHMLFDEKKRQCVPHKKAHCGSRPNPYDQHSTPLQSTNGELSEATTEVPVRQTASSPTVADEPFTSRPSKTNELKQFLTFFPKQDSDIITSPDNLENDISNNIARKSEESKGSSDETKKENVKNLNENFSEGVSVEKTDIITSPDSLENDISNDIARESEESKRSSDKPKKENVKNVNENFSEGVSVGKTVDPKDVTVNALGIKLSEETSTESSRTENFSSSNMADCLPGDKTCIRLKDGLVFRCPSLNGFFSHPSDENAFFHCYNKKFYIKKCPKGLIFLQSKAACTWSVDKFQKA